MEENRTVEIKASSMADPTSLGITSFAIALFTLSFANAGITGANASSIFVPLALVTALIHFFTCLYGFKKGELFTVVVFGIYGMFWAVFALINIGVAAKLFVMDTGELFWFFVAYTIFTVYVVIASLVTNKAVILTLVVLLITFILLDLGFYGNTNATFIKYGGYAGIVDGLLAFYISAMILVNGLLGKNVLPAGGPIIK